MEMGEYDVIFIKNVILCPGKRNRKKLKPFFKMRNNLFFVMILIILGLILFIIFIVFFIQFFY